MDHPDEVSWTLLTYAVKGAKTWTFPMLWRIQGRPPLICRPIWGPKGRKKFFFRSPPPPLSQDLDEWASPPYLKVWLRHCYDLVYRTQPPTHAGYQSVFLGGGAGGGMLRGWSHTESKPRAARLQLKTFSMCHFNETEDRAWIASGIQIRPHWTTN